MTEVEKKLNTGGWTTVFEKEKYRSLEGEEQTRNKRTVFPVISQCAPVYSEKREMYVCTSMYYCVDMMHGNVAGVCGLHLSLCYFLSFSLPPPSRPHPLPSSLALPACLLARPSVHSSARWPRDLHPCCHGDVDPRICA